MRLLAGLAITYCVLIAAVPAVAQSTQTSADAGAAQLMNAAFLRGGSLDFHLLQVSREWPPAFSVKSSTYDLRLTPHAGLGVSELGGAAEAGAVLTFGPKPKGQSLSARLGTLSVQNRAGSNETGRWYMFAAASGRALRFNMQPDESQGWDRAWSQDRSSALVGDAQLGLSWRRGDLQTSVGLIHRTVKGDHMLWGQETKDDSVLAFSFSVKPQH